MDEKLASHSFTAVVIDDDPVMRALIRAGLELVAGWRVILEPGAAPGIERVGRESPDVVVVDYLLPHDPHGRHHEVGHRRPRGAPSPHGAPAG